jgi:hypothetical protein
MTREETRFSVLMICVLAALFAATQIHSETVTTVVLLLFPLVFLAHIRVADTNHRVYGPVWLRRAQWAFIGGILLVSVLMLRVF